MSHDKPSMIAGNQKWKGAVPIFIAKEEFIIILIKSLKKNIFILIILIIIINNKFIEAIDWIKKYFKEASEERRLLDWEIKGINLNKLISKPIQHPNQELEEIEINVLLIRVKKKNILLKLLFIKI